MRLVPQRNTHEENIHRVPYKKTSVPQRKGGKRLNTECERCHNSKHNGETQLHRRYFKHARHATIDQGMINSRHTHQGQTFLGEDPDAPFHGFSNYNVVFEYIPINSVTQYIIWAE